MRGILSYYKIVIIGFLLSGNLVALELGSSEDAINIAGKQRMLSYRILKDYLMISMESEYKNPIEDMKKCIQNFDEARKALAAYNKDATLQSLLQTVEKKFFSVKEMITQPFEKSKGDVYLNVITEMKEVSHQIVLRLQEIYKQESSVIVNKAGRLRAISQRINALYLLKTLEASSSSINKNMQDAMKIFRESLDYLQHAALPDATMQKKLKKIDKIYVFFQIMNESDNYVPIIIGKKSSRMLKTADELVNLYIKQLNKE